MEVQLYLSPRLKTSPYFEATRRYGARSFSVYNKMYLPAGYSDPETEYRSLIEGVTLWDVSVQRIVEIAGADALVFTNLLTPRDLTRCPVGKCRYVVITAPDGGILNDPVLLRLGEDRFWLSRADSDILMWARGVSVNAGLDVAVREPDVAPLQLQGPKSRDVMASLFGPEVTGLDYYELVETELDGIPLVVSRTGWSAELGYEFYPQGSNRGEELWERIMAAGKPHDIRPATPSRIRRIEAGILDYSVDMDAGTNPYEVGLGWMVKLDQEADFIGRAALARIKAEGIKRRLVGLEIEGAALPANLAPWPVWRDGQDVGQVTSAVYSPRLGRNIGYAMLDAPHAELGNKVAVETVEGTRAATVVEKPFVDPRKALARE